MIRVFSESDFQKIREIYYKYYEDEFELPEFCKFVMAFTTTDDDGKIIATGGVRPLMEMVCVTDQSFDPFVRRASYFNILSACRFSLKGLGYKELHVFTQGKRWTNIVKDTGFRETAGTALVMDIED